MKATICDNCQSVVKAKVEDFYIIKIYKNEDWKDIKVVELCTNCFKKWSIDKNLNEMLLMS